jgi:5'-phosphate synthase pdxT subunit
VSRPRIGVLALQGDVREHVRMLTESGAEASLVRRPEELERVDGIVIPGGESTTIGRLLDVFDLLEPLRKAVGEGLPAYGSCAGMILLGSSVLDGRPDQPLLGVIDMTVRRNAFGRQVDSFEADLDFVGLAEPEMPLHAVFIRAPAAEGVGDEVDVLATVTDGRVHKPVAVRSGPHLATAFHPELTRDGRVHDLFVAMVKEQA